MFYSCRLTDEFIYDLWSTWVTVHKQHAGRQRRTSHWGWLPPLLAALPLMLLCTARKSTPPLPPTMPLRPQPSNISQNRSLRQDLLNLSRGAHAPCPTMTSQPRLRLHDYMSCQLINAMTGILQTVYSSERWFHQFEIRSLAHGHKHGICLPGFWKKKLKCQTEKNKNRHSIRICRSAYNYSANPLSLPVLSPLPVI